MQRILKEKEAVKSFMEELSSSPNSVDIVGYHRHQEGAQEYVIETRNGNILVKLAEVTIEHYASPISKPTRISGRHGNLIYTGSGKTSWLIDPDRLDISIKRQIEANIEKHDVKAGFETSWLLVYSLSAFPQVENCVRGVSKMSKSLVTAREYLKSFDQVIFDQIWYTNLMTRPVQVWPYSLGESLC